MKVNTLFTDIDEVGEYAGEGESILQPWTVDSFMCRFGVENKGLSAEQIEAAKQLLHRNLPVFSQSKTGLIWLCMKLIQVMLDPLNCILGKSPSTCKKKWEII